MKTTNKTKKAAGLLSVMALGSASAVTALIDFGTSNTPTYNQAAMGAAGSAATTGVVALNDTAAAPTGWTVTVLNTGSGNGGNAGAGANALIFPAAVSGFETTAVQDSIYANQGAGVNPAMVVTFAGLSTSATYDLLLYGSRLNAQGADQQWSLTEGTGGGLVSHFSEDNQTTVVDWTSVSPNGSGVIEILINADPAGDNVGALALNFGSITENAIPEPSGASLLGLSLGMLFLRRKRK
ncbi:PEP-CTERM sorting domain-containing protein [Akkermansiaceae bacterium]|nr:PEP-CTERM sorting domain-containing protein [Akkermansiaceae bacterium]MDA7888306.1 PEP-CTERM sorting domain-containing protein [Akkermansiaceae bacterium]